MIQQSSYQPTVTNHHLVAHHPSYQTLTLRQSYQAHAIQQPSLLSFPQLGSGLVVPSFLLSDYPIATAFQTDDLDAFDFDCDDAPSAKAILMANLSYYDSHVLSEVIVDRNAKVADFEKQIHLLKLQINATVKSHTILSTIVECLKKESKEKEDKYLDEVIDLQNKNKALDNVVYKMGQSTQTMHMLTKPQAFYDESHKKALGYPNPFYLSQAQRKVPTLYDGHTIVKQHDPFSIPDTEETLELAEENKKYCEIEKKELILENDRLLEHIICQDVMNVVMHADDHNELSANNNCLDNDNLALELLKMENDHLMELLISQDLVHTVVNSLAAINDYKYMEQSFLDEDEENLKLQTDLDKKNDIIQKALEAKNVSIEKLKEHIANLKGKNVVDNVQTVHNLNVVTLKVYKLDLQPLSPRIKNNRDAHVYYLKVTQEHTDTLQDIVEQSRALKPLNNALDYALNSSTEASGSKSRSNTKKDRITQTSSSNKKKNKVEDHHRIAKSSLNNMNCVSKPVCNANVKHSVLNRNSELICATCHECMFDAIHDLCVRHYLNDVNARVKSKSVRSKLAKSNMKKC
ncbi:hypothetical protein Tco_1116307 [Tanacetum coccineum]